MSRGINMRSCMHRESQLREITQRAVLYTLSKPQEFPNSINVIYIRRHAVCDTVCDVVYPPIAVHLSPDRPPFDRWDATIGGFGPRYRRISCICCRDSEREEEEWQKQIDDCRFGHASARWFWFSSNEFFRFRRKGKKVGLYKDRFPCHL